MNNTEKKLDALIDALGSDVEEVNEVSYGEGVQLGKMAIQGAGKQWEYFPDEELYREVISTVDYKLTKRNPKQTQQEFIVEVAKTLLNQVRIYDLPVSEITYRGVTVKYRKDKENIEVIYNEEI